MNGNNHSSIDSIDAEQPAGLTFPGISVMLVLESDVARFGLSSMMAQVRLAYSVTCPDSVEDAVAWLARHHADVVILSHPEMDERIQQVTDLTSRSGGQLLLLLGSESYQEQINAAVSLRPDGILLQKDLTVAVLEDALERVVRGEMLMPRLVAKALLDRVGVGPPPEASPRSPNLIFTPREREALDLLAEGLSNKQIARRLGISLNSTKRHVGNVLAKLNSPNRTLAVARALQAGLVLSERGRPNED